MMLAGIYAARLCIDCRNAWAQYVRTHELFQDMEKVTISQSVAEIVYHGTGDFVTCNRVLQDLSEKQANLEMQMFETAKDWCDSE